MSNFLFVEILINEFLVITFILYICAVGFSYIFYHQYIYFNENSKRNKVKVYTSEQTLRLCFIARILLKVYRRTRLFKISRRRGKICKFDWLGVCDPGFQVFAIIIKLVYFYLYFSIPMRVPPQTNTKVNSPFYYQTHSNTHKYIKF